MEPLGPQQTNCVSSARVGGGEEQGGWRGGVFPLQCAAGF